MKAPTVISMIGDLIDARHTMNAHCRGCGRTSTVDLEALPRRLGLDFVYVRARIPFSCAVCGSKEVSITIGGGHGFSGGQGERR
ncbi:hypothetical protein [Prosthecomicrobium sp. N25]|uniref:hypothetical protein n=1 Tax=Prosthecomicrobium sp. N25 TaxID=3129254 RepID=UPI00307763D4